MGICGCLTKSISELLMLQYELLKYSEETHIVILCFVRLTGAVFSQRQRFPKGLLS